MEILTRRREDATIRRTKSSTPRLRFIVSPRRYLIIGCGQFGSRAARTLLGKSPHSKITIVDRDEQALQKVFDLSVEKVLSDGLSYLDRVLLDGPATGYIVPAVPCHLAFEFVLLRLKSLGARKGKILPLHGLPNPMMGKTGDLYTSLADFLCPEDCTEPSQFCTTTRKKRPKPLFKILEEWRGPFDPMVIRSLQLGPGVGGYRPEALLGPIETIKNRRGSNRPFLISTACRCHGVTSALSLEGPL